MLEESLCGTRCTLHDPSGDLEPVYVTVDVSEV